MTDFCSWWPEGNWAYCCYEHDIHILNDWGFAQCVANSPGVWALGGAMGFIVYVGLKCGGWLYRLTKRHNGEA